MKGMPRINKTLLENIETYKSLKGHLEKAKEFSKLSFCHEPLH
jgi:hypothetical protein